MSIYADRVKQSVTSPGSGTVTLSGTASTGYQTFLSAFGAGNTTVAYCIADQSGNNWEVGTGAYSSSGNTLTRVSIFASSNSNSLVNFASGTQDVFCTAPARYLDTFTSTSQGVVPASGGGTTNYLRADGSWVALFSGATGAPGQDGADGEDGPPGPPGTTGPQGPQGIAGVIGAVGAPGNDGEDGDIGPPGTAGAVGATGATGATGLQGAVGFPGFDGEDGDIGPPGPAGTRGATGNNGANGLQGPPGEDGQDADSFLIGIPPGKPAGANTQVQYNNSGAFGASSLFTYTVGTNTITFGNITGSATSMTIQPLAPTSGSAGTLTLLGRNGVATNGAGGGLTFTAGNGTGTGSGGAINAVGGNGNAGGGVQFNGGNGTGTGSGGAVGLQGGSSINSAGGTAALNGGQSINNNGGFLNFEGGTAVTYGQPNASMSLSGSYGNGQGGSVNFFSGDAGVGSGANAGSFLFQAGVGDPFSFPIVDGSLIFISAAGTTFKITSDGAGTSQIGFFNVTPVQRQSATTLAQVISALQAYGLLV